MAIKNHTVVGFPRTRLAQFAIGTILKKPIIAALSKNIESGAGV